MYSIFLKYDPAISQSSMNLNQASIITNTAYCNQGSLHQKLLINQGINLNKMKYSKCTHGLNLHLGNMFLLTQAHLYRIRRQGHISDEISKRLDLDILPCSDEISEISEDISEISEEISDISEEISEILE